MRRFLQVTLIGFVISMLVLAFTRAPDANASVAYVSPYTFDQTYGSGLRLLRVDLGFKILEKDKENGYVMFEYTSSEAGNKSYPGSLSLVETKDGVHVAMQIPQMPQYHERMLIDLLAKKLTEEHGEPLKREKEKDKSKDKDADGDKDKSKDKDADGDKGEAKPKSFDDE